MAPADTGVFLFLALNTHFEIQIDAEVFRLRIGAGPGLNHDAIRIPGGQCRLGNETVGGLFQIDFNFPAGGLSSDRDDLIARRNWLHGGVVKDDFNFAVTGDKEFSLLGLGFEESSSFGTGNDLFSVERSDGAKGGDRECDGLQFHWIRIFDD